jgi:dihydrodipicolinate synthase/N-acetylneuraminate lyase
MLLSGIFPAITTPFYPDGRLYPRKLEHNVDRYSRSPIAGIVVLGSTGEAVHLSTEEQKDVLRVARENCANEKVLIAGVGQESAQATLELVEIAEKLDYDVALVRTPSFYRPQMKSKPESLLAYYRFVADRSALPVLLYSVPPFTAYDLPVEMVAELASHPNIIGIKESSGNVEKIAATKQAVAKTESKRDVPVTATFEAFTRRMAAASAAPANGNFVSADALGGTAVVAPPKPQAGTKTRSKNIGFQIAAGSAQVLLTSLNAGASAAVLAFAAAAPTACFEVFAAWKDGNEKLAEEKQQRIVAAAQRVAAGFGVPGVKYAMDLNGYYGGNARLPLLPLTQSEKDEIASMMRDLRN